MVCGKAAIYGAVTTLLLLSVLLLAVFARPSSSYEAVNKNKKNSRQDFELARDASATLRGQKREEISSVRLPRHLTPIEYLVHLHPNLTTFNFSGKVDALLYCNEDSNNITLHIGNKIHETSVRVAHIPDLNDKSSVTELEIHSITRLPHREMFVIRLDSLLLSGEYYFLIIEYNSVLSRGLSGFYLSTYYSSSGEKRYLATTHFEPTDARNAFPCFDEPNMKAHFTIVITREKRHRALANMPLARTEGCGDAVDLCIDHFQKSVKMSTYLVAFVVCDYQSIESHTSKGVKVRVWAPPDQVNQGRFALYVAVKVLQYYEEIFQVDYPLPKQDLIAIPDFAAGAMENWGLITYRLTSLLYDEEKSSDSNKQWVAIVVAHELAHQWFGNLVTMEWWNDLWLNEGFASFMENVGVNHTEPQWKMFDQFYLDKFQASLALDQLSNSHPIMAEVTDPAQINSLFDTISYDKGASIIRMLEDVLGKGVFFKGLQHYLNKYSFGNAETDDLWSCLTEEMEKIKGVGKGIDVKRMMDTWTNQMGCPVVTIKRSSKRPVVLAEQQHFLIHPRPQSSSNSGFSWIIPLTFVTQDSDTRYYQMINGREQEVNLPPETRPESWIKMNAGQSGYYRINYDAENWDRLRHQLVTDHTVLTAADRAGLLDDALNLARADMLDDVRALELTTYLNGEDEYVPWMSALNNLAYFATQFSVLDSVNNGATDYYPTFKRYVFYLLKDIAAKLGWEEKHNDAHLKRYLRATVLHLAADYEDVDEPGGYESQAVRLFNAWLTNPSNSITPNLRSIVYSIGVKKADESTWNEVFRRFQKERVPSEKRKLMYALTNTQRPVILERLLKYSLDETKIRSQDSVAVINSIALNPEGRLLAWNFVKINYKELYNRYGKGSFDFSRMIKATTAHFNTQEMEKEVAEFFAGVDQGSGKLAVQQSLESIAANIKWIKGHSTTVYRWIEQFLRTTVSVRASHVRRTFYDETLEKYGRP